MLFPQSKLISSSNNLDVKGVKGLALPLLLADVTNNFHGLNLVLTESAHHSIVLEEELELCAAELKDKIYHFPAWDTLPYDVFSPNPEIVSQRLAFLYKVSQNITDGILIIPIHNLMQRLSTKSFIKGRALFLQVNSKFDIEQKRLSFENNGYHCVTEVREPGEFAVRGGVIDIFPTGTNNAFRLELFDDEIESIRIFDPETQRSIQTVEQINILPANEFPFDEAGRMRFLQEFRENFNVDSHKCSIYQDVRKVVQFSGIEHYLPMFFAQTASLFDYLPKDTRIIHTGKTKAILQTWDKQIQARYQERKHDIQRPVVKPESLYLCPNEVVKKLTQYQTISLNQSSDGIDFHTQLPNRYNSEIHKNKAQWLQAQLKHNKRILLAADSLGRIDIIKRLFLKEKLVIKETPSIMDFIHSDESIAITIAAIENGTNLIQQNIIILDESCLFGTRANRTRKKKRFKVNPDEIISNLSELHIGSPIVHVDHGVARYKGLEIHDFEEEAEFLVLEYYGGDKLFVPVSSLHLVSRYTGASAENAPWHKLGGDKWQKIREKAAKKVKDVAAELLQLYAIREARGGKKINLNESEYLQFCQGFPFEETDDQLTTIKTVIADLQSSKSMDRVVCGDVGFGKTEVALRAAFVVANDAKQVAILVPTTLLAQQHFETFLDRFAYFPIKVAVLSRFVKKAQQTKILAGITNGTVDIVIGTHKLLQKDIKFKNLGLIVIDEEHRFGVRQKERLKKLRAEVDILTLTATPIPRTLNTALSGLRDLSIIATPPKLRLSIKTQVIEWDTATIKEACLREIQRGGQVYFLHNEVRTIEQMAETVQNLVPQARVRVAHGQMHETDLQAVMLDFHKVRFNILVCSTIIENGIDIPTANTIIMNRADKLGLAQMHQLRGRVGRSHHKAFAYMLIPGWKSITKDAAKRLEAIVSLEDLGSGFTLATHDLEIRGAGELLGDEQSGQIHAIGFSLYCELLERAVAALKEDKEPQLDDLSIHETQVELNIPALLPDDYIPDVYLRLTFYKRLSGCQEIDEVTDLRVELIDRFGLLPDQAKNLFEIKILQLKSNAFDISNIQVNQHGGTVKFATKDDEILQKLITLIQTKYKIYKPMPNNSIRILGDFLQAEQRFEAVEQLYLDLGINFISAKK
ncbi:MAG: transcription-repair coupling factor [Proteobacteria bacterium]|nr:transcription-repair coupling factor [Pseudomonadota bacterium]